MKVMRPPRAKTPEVMQSSGHDIVPVAPLATVWAGSVRVVSATLNHLWFRKILYTLDSFRRIADIFSRAWHCAPLQMSFFTSVFTSPGVIGRRRAQLYRKIPVKL